MKNRLIILICLLCPVVALSGQSRYADYMKAVAERNAAYVAERFNVDIAAARSRAACVFNDPELSLEYGNNQDWSLQMGQSVEAELSYQISFGNVRQARINLARSEEEYARAALDDWFRNLRTDAVIAWTEAQRTKRMLEVKKASCKDLEALASSDSLRASLGDGSPVDARQSRLEAKAARAEQLTAEADYANALSALSLLAGGILFEDISDEESSLPLLSGSLDMLTGQALANRADLRVAELSNLLSQRNLALVKASRFPEVNLIAGYSYNTEVRNSIAPAPHFHGLKVGITIPLKFSRFNRGEQRAAESAIQQSEAAYEAARQQIITEVRQAFTSYQAALAVATECSESMLSDAASVLESRRTAYLQGDSSLLDYLLAQRVYNDTAEQCITAQAELLKTKAELFRAVGSPLFE